MGAERLWVLAGQLAVSLAAEEGGHRQAVQILTDNGVVTGAAHPHPSAGDARKLSVEEQKQLLGSIYAAFWTFKIIAAGVVICILGLHGACCLFPNYKTSDADRLQEILEAQRGLPPPTFLQRVKAMFGIHRPPQRAE